MNYKIRFSEIEYKVNNSSGVYEIFTKEEARSIEIKKEQMNFRYVGRVQIR